MEKMEEEARGGKTGKNEREMERSIYSTKDTNLRLRNKTKQKHVH